MNATQFEIQIDGDTVDYEGVLCRVMQDGYTVTLEGLLWNVNDAKENYPIAIELQRRFTDGTFYFDGEVLPPEFGDFSNDIDYVLDQYNIMKGSISRSGLSSNVVRFELLALDPTRAKAEAVAPRRVVRKALVKP